MAPGDPVQRLAAKVLGDDLLLEVNAERATFSRHRLSSGPVNTRSVQSQGRTPHTPNGEVHRKSLKTLRGVLVDFKTRVDAAMQAIGATLRRRFDEASERIRDALADPSLAKLLAEYERFHWHDVVTFPFLEGTTAEEHSEVQVFRQPRRQRDRSAPRQARRDQLRRVGGFLSRDWREHDILWGRLDGAERIVAALIPDPKGLAAGPLCGEAPECDPDARIRRAWDEPAGRDAPAPGSGGQGEGDRADL